MDKAVWVHYEDWDYDRSGEKTCDMLALVIKPDGEVKEMPANSQYYIDQLLVQYPGVEYLGRLSGTADGLDYQAEFAAKHPEVWTVLVLKKGLRRLPDMSKCYDIPSYEHTFKVDDLASDAKTLFIDIPDIGHSVSVELTGAGLALRVYTAEVSDAPLLATELNLSR